MYTEFYGFSEDPFNLTPEPKFLLLTKTHQQALDFMAGGIKERRGTIAILGELGSGKTTLIQHLLNTIDKKVKAVVVFNPYSSVEELLEYTLRELGVPSSAKDKVSLAQQLGDFLQRLALEETLAIIIDEAHHLSPQVVEELCRLAAPQRPGAQKLQILLVGETGGQAKLESADLQKRNQKIAAVSQILALDEEECREYIAHRLRKVGSDIGRVMTPEAISLICQYSRGNPRTINVLCDNAFLIGYGLSRKKVDSEIVTEVLEDLDFVAQKEFPGWQPKDRREFRARSMKGINPLFRKISYSLLALVGVGAIIFLGRIFLKAPEEKQATRFPIPPPVAREKIALPPPEAKPAVPSPAVERKSTASSPEPNAPLSPPAKGLQTEPEPKGAAAQIAKTGAEVRVQKTVVVKAKDSIYTIAAKNYQHANTSVVDRILDLNPGIANPNKLTAGQEIRLPEITEESLIIPSSDGTYKIRLGTFLKPEYSTFLHGQPALRGRAIEIIPRKLPSGETWYRVVAGKFSSREESLKAVHILREKGLSPYFAGFRRNK